jgi:rRNA maturation endonuclease Nob1
MAIWAFYNCTKCHSIWKKWWKRGGWDNRPKMHCPDCGKEVKANSYEEALGE